MFQSETLKKYLEESNTIETNALVLAEWNLNQPENISRIGNYRYRPQGSDAQYAVIPSIYDINDIGNYYTGATDADAVIDGGIDNDGDPLLFTKPKKKFSMIYSLEDCFNPFRPRSGINKPIYLGPSGSDATSAQYITNPSPYDEIGQDVVNEGYIVNRPRYYMSSPYDQFRYWTSYRTENGIEYGVSKTKINGLSFIYDVAPFVVYKDTIPSNRIIVKMQTNVGDVNLGDMRIMGQADPIPDPLYGYSNQTTPVRWKIQVLKDTSWVDVSIFDENSLRDSGANIIGSDGYVELSYGLQIPTKYKEIFTYAGTLSSSASLPSATPSGYAYLVKSEENSKGVFYVYYVDEWESFIPQYEWQLSDDSIGKNSKFVSEITNPDYFIDQGKKIYREVDLIDGVRIVVDTMNRENCTFDLIELSPRLAIDLTPRTQDFSVTKTLSDLGNGNIPVGSLLAGIGKISINNNDFAFSDTNYFDKTTSLGSLISKYLLTNIKFVFYDVIKNVNGYDYYLPIKTMYSEGFPQSDGNFDQISMNLRDAFFIIESSPAPSLMLTDSSLSNIVTILMDYIGFSNYTFKRVSGQADPIIPYFFVAPNQNVAEVLNQIAKATQSAMFFDEYNNLVVMTKEYLMPDNNESNPINTRASSAQILGNTYVTDADNNHYMLQGFVYSASMLPAEDITGAIIDRSDNNIYVKINNSWQSKGEVNQVKLPNIIQVSAANKSVNNNGQINYTKRYIQRNYGSTKQAMYQNEFKSWVYSPTLLWEVSGDDRPVATNEMDKQSSYALTAMALNTDLSADIPTVVNNTIINNIIDVGENIYLYARYNGYLYANGEVIKYDAIEYSVSGYAQPIWINNTQEYQNYLLALKFNGKMYPTGNIRIWTEPEYITVNGVSTMKPGAVKKHGRGQFGTPIVSHSAGLDPFWTNNDNVYGCNMKSSYLFTPAPTILYPVDIAEGVAGVDSAKAKQSTRTGLIKNILSQQYWTETESNKINRGSLQSSALVFSGPNFDATFSPRDYVSYINKPTNDAYTHFGTRMRVIGNVASNSNKIQTPVGGSEYISINPTNNTQETALSGGSGGIGIMVDPTTNAGYYFEICALTAENIDQYKDNSIIQTTSYEIKQNASIGIDKVVTITTTKNHGFSVGDTIVVSGLSKTYMNGKFTVTEVVSPVSLKYQVNTKFAVSKTSTTASVATLTTASDHNFFVGQSVEISGIRMYSTITQKALSASVATLTFDNSHRFQVNDYVAVNNVDATFNGRHQVTGITSNTITYALNSASTIAPTAASGTVVLSWTNSYMVSGASMNNGTATISIGAGHAFSVGDMVSVSDVGGKYNGMHKVTATTGTSISYNTPYTVTEVIIVSGDGMAIKERFDSAYNGTKTVTVAEGSTFSFASSIATIPEQNVLTTSSYAEGSTIATTSSDAGTATREAESSTEISNLYFYKVMQGQQTFSIENNGASVDSGVVTIETIRTHGYSVGTEIVIKDLNVAALNGKFTITSVPQSNRFSFNISGVSNQNGVGGMYGSVYTEEKEAIPYRLWSGLTSIIADSGNFVGQYRTVTEEKTTVYDLAVEYEDTATARIFYLYLNNKQIASVTDEKPLTKRNNMCLFIRGSSKCMFENVYALTNNYSQNTMSTVVSKVADVFGDTEINNSEALKKYAVSGFVQASYLSGISSYQPPEFNMYYEEFGTIMREAAHFNIKYDRAFPALYAKLSPTINKIKTFATSGFYAGAYGADFLIFNCTDTLINLDASSGNYLRIQGITFTQNTTKTLTVDDYFNKIADFSDPQIDNGNLVYNPKYQKQVYNEIKNSRIRHGNQEFTIDSPFIQSDAAAEDIMGWIIKKTMKPKRNIGLTTFGTQMLQLGDIVNVYYKNPDGIDIITPESKSYVVYNIEYNRRLGETAITTYLAEV